MADEQTAAPKTGVTDITAKSPKSGRAITIKRDLGLTLKDTIALFGEDVVHSMATAQIEIRIQGAGRSTLDAGYKDGKVADQKLVNSEDAAKKAATEYMPGVARKGGGRKPADPMDKLADLVDSGQMDQKDIIAELQKRLAAKKMAAAEG